MCWQFILWCLWCCSVGCFSRYVHGVRSAGGSGLWERGGLGRLKVTENGWSGCIRSHWVNLLHWSAVLVQIGWTVSSAGTQSPHLVWSWVWFLFVFLFSSPYTYQHRWYVPSRWGYKDKWWFRFVCLTRDVCVFLLWRAKSSELSLCDSSKLKWACNWAAVMNKSQESVSHWNLLPVTSGTETSLKQ